MIKLKTCQVGKVSHALAVARVQYWKNVRWVTGLRDWISLRAKLQVHTDMERVPEGPDGTPRSRIARLH